MKSIFMFSLLSLALFTCNIDETSLDQKDVNVVVKDSRPIPENTIRIIDYDKVLVKSDNKIKMVNIENPEEMEVLYEVTIPSGRNFRSLYLERYVIFDQKQDVYSQIIIDMITGQSLELYNDEYSSAVLSINPINHSILYRNQISYPELGGLLSRLYSITFDGTVNFLADSMSSAKWSPDGKWIFLKKFSYKEGYLWHWQSNMINLSGDEIHIFDKSISTSLPMWTDDGSYALFQVNNTNGKIIILKFDWSKNSPEFKQISTGDNVYDPVFWSPDGQYFIHTTENSDGHELFGNDVWISDRNLNFKKDILSHYDVLETPIKWTEKDGLITSTNGQIVRYDILD